MSKSFLTKKKINAFGFLPLAMASTRSAKSLRAVDITAQLETSGEATEKRHGAGKCNFLSKSGPKYIFC
jgi:hypothetical protein